MARLLLLFFFTLILVIPAFSMQYRDKDWLRDHTYMPYMNTAAVVRMKSKDENFRTIKSFHVSPERMRAKKNEAPVLVDEKTKVLAAAFGRLAHNQQRSEKEKSDFEQKIQRDLPEEISDHIVKYMAVGLVSGHSIKEMSDDQERSLLSCVIKRQRYLPAVSELLDEAAYNLNLHFRLIESQLPQREHPYIVGVCGLWSFEDEPSKFRYKLGHENFATKLNQYFAQAYPNAAVKPLRADEFVGAQYSDGTFVWNLSGVSSIFLKKMFRDQWLFCSRLGNVDGFFSENELAKYRSLPLFVQKCIKNNFDIASSANARMFKDGKSMMPLMLGVGAVFDYRIGSLLAANTLLNILELYKGHKDQNVPKGRNQLSYYWEPAEEVGYSIGLSLGGLFWGGVLRAFIWCTKGTKFSSKPYSLSRGS